MNSSNTNALPVVPTPSVPLVAPPVSFWQAFAFWLKLGFISFGGPAGQISIMHQELVERRRWISERRFLHALNYCMLLPGPEAQQLATYIGWLMHKTRGGIVAGVLFVLPSLLILMALSWIYIAYGDVPLVAGLFYGIKPAVTAIVVQAAHRIGSRALKNNVLWCHRCRLLRGAHAAVSGPVCAVARPVAELRRRSRDAQARHGDVRRALCLVPALPRRGAQLASQDVNARKIFRERTEPMPCLVCSTPWKE